MKHTLGIFSLFVAYNYVKCTLEPFITGGSYVEYSQYPHSTFLLNFCKDKFSCGGSVLNQNIVLTAAHCLEDCAGVETDKLYVKYGHKKIKSMKQTKMKYFKYHQQYDEITLSNDIGLIMTEDRIPLTNIVKRVIIMRSPPNEKDAFVAGWGMDEHLKAQSLLKHTSSVVRSSHVCQSMGWLPRGTFCAGPLNGLGAANKGDSGSALIVRNYIEIGLVSFKVPDHTLVAYTNVSFFVDWIEENASDLFCLDANSTEEKL